jgi:hypothetical protein
MPATLWLPALIKAATTALLVVCASALAEALGPFWGALVASLPVSAGPAYVFLAMQHNSDFIAASALSSAAANAATGLFLLVYAILARRMSPWQGLGVAVLAWLVASLAIRPVVWSPATVLLLNLGAYGIGFILCRSVEPASIAPAASRTRRSFDIPVRAIAVALFVTAVVVASSMLGPEATGIAAVFPISLISLIVILRPRIGGAASAVLAASALRAMLGFGLMLLTLHLTIPLWGTGTALMVALFVSVAWSGGLLILRRRSHPG